MAAGLCACGYGAFAAIDAKAELVAIEASWSKAVVAKVVAYSKTSGGLAVVAAVGYVVAKFDVLSLIAKFI